MVGYKMQRIRKNENIKDFILPLGGRNHKCGVCQKEFVTFWATKRHVLSVHAEVGMKKCPQEGCEEKFQSHNQMRAHAIKEHGEGLLHCPFQGCSVTGVDINGYTKRKVGQ